MLMIRYADDGAALLFALVQVPDRGFIFTGYGEGDRHAVIPQVRMDGELGSFIVMGDFPRAWELRAPDLARNPGLPIPVKDALSAWFSGAGGWLVFLLVRS